MNGSSRKRTASHAPTNNTKLKPSPTKRGAPLGALFESFSISYLRETVRSVVVFTGSAEFKAGVPEGVYDLSGLVDYIRQQRHESMSLNRMQFCIGRLEAMHLAISGVTDAEHVQSLERRHGVAA